ncbi:hypothetical protein L5M38_22185 [Shewanella sp. SM101]|uniref:hypothetical protein n=1 Tax=unclassified Shewanella TaxID=196818 RepID=UPI0021DAB5A4|nr:MULTISPECIES: hypothetical protein [unclassified Shewanella]MCU8008981.1 hypothetical protein [Shewanella sp. SM87]MCU8107217.1 hypothetical protein [Shewanella sp. SM101]
MGLFDSEIIIFEGKEYILSKIMFNKINKLADLFYQDLGYISRHKFNYYESPHPTERAMFKMALRALVFTKKIKPSADAS